MRRAICTWTVISLFLLPLPAVAQQNFEMHPLFEPNGMQSIALGLAGDPIQGIHVVGTSENASSVDQAFYWFDSANCDPNWCLPGVSSDFLPSLNPAMPSAAVGVRPPSVVSDKRSSAGAQAWGNTQTLAGLSKPALWEDPGTGWALTPLPMLPGLQGSVHAGTRFGPLVLAGQSLDAAAIQKAVVWEWELITPGAWAIVPLPHSEAAAAGLANTITRNTASAIVIDVVGGWSDNLSGEQRPQVWTRPSGGSWNRTELPTLAGGVEGAVMGSARKADGSVVLSGWSEKSGMIHEAVYWEEVAPGSWTVMGLGAVPGFTQSESWATTEYIGSSSTYQLHVGVSYTDTPSDGVASYWESGSSGTASWDLNTRIMDSPTLVAQQATGVSIFQNGAAVGIAIAGFGPSQSPASRGSSTGDAAKIGEPHAWLLTEDVTVPVSVRSGVASIPITAEPNPFQTSTSISFSMKEPGRVVLTIYDVAGRKVTQLLSGSREPGIHSVNWSGRDADGRALATGVYLVQLELGGRTAAQKLLHLR